MKKVEQHLSNAAGDPYEAAKVSRFMSEDCPKTSPSENWKLHAFEVGEEEAAHRQLVALFSSTRRMGVGSDHYVREGSYVTLMRRRDWRQHFKDIEDERSDGPLSDREKEIIRKILPDYLPMMSDTHNEITDHDDVIQHAGGRMLIHGLGLGCIVAALHVIPAVEHIDVVEIDPEVIAMTGGYYMSLPKVNLVQADAMKHEWPKGAHWDYVWHDIWERISTQNLNPEDAEYGISYDMLFERFDGRAERQGAWAYDRALEMYEVEAVQEQEAEELMENWKEMSQREREDVLILSKMRSPISEAAINVEQFRNMVDEAENRPGMEGWYVLFKQIEETAKTQDTLNMGEALMILGYLSLDDMV